MLLQSEEAAWSLNVLVSDISAETDDDYRCDETGLTTAAKDGKQIKSKKKFRIQIYCNQYSNHNTQKTKLESQVSSVSQQSPQSYFYDNRQKIYCCNHGAFHYKM